MSEIDLPSAIEFVFADTAARFNCASVTRDDDHPSGGVGFVLRCTEPVTVPIWACVSRETVDLFIGNGFHADMVITRHNPPDRVVEYVASLLHAATTAEVEEREWKLGRRTLRMRTVVRLLDHSEVVGSITNPLGLVIRGRRKSEQYRPYR